MGHPSTVTPPAREDEAFPGEDDPQQGRLTARSVRVSNIAARNDGDVDERREELSRGAQLTPPAVHPKCPKCGAPMRAGSTSDPELGEQLPVWRCIRCGTEVPR